MTGVFSTPQPAFGVWRRGAAKSVDEAKSKEYADLAYALLAETLDRGFHDLIFPEHNRMSADPALAPGPGTPEDPRSFSRAGHERALE